MDENQFKQDLGDLIARAVLAGVRRNQIIQELEVAKLCLFQAFVEAKNQERETVTGSN